MKLQTLLDERALLIESHMIQSRKILKESCDGLTHDQRRIVEGIYNELRPLIEASLTSDQIKGIFGAVEKQAVASGDSRTLAGKGIDTAKKANEIINNVGKWLQDTTPVKMADQKFENLKAKVSSKFPELDKQLTGFGTWMKENPGKTAAVIGVLTALASLAGGPVGGAIAGQVLRGAQELFKGEKLSTAVGKGLKTAAVAGLAGLTMDAVGDMISDVYQQFNPIPIDADATYQVINIGNGLPSTYQNAALYGTEEQLGQFSSMWQDAQNKWNSGDYAGAEQAFQQAKDFAEQTSNETMNAIAIDGDPAEKIQALNQAMDSLTAAAQGAAAGVSAFDQQGKPVTGGAVAKQESYYVQTRPVSEGQVYMLFDRVLTEAGILDKIKTGAGKAAGAVAKGAAWAGKQATEKVTSAKLLASWKLEGSPTDSEELAKFLKGQGISDDIVKQVYGDMKLPAPGSAPAATIDIETIKQMITKLPVDRRARLLTYLLGGKKATAKTAPAPEEDNPNIVKGTESKMPRGSKL